MSPREQTLKYKLRAVLDDIRRAESVVVDLINEVVLRELQDAIERELLDRPDEETRPLWLQRDPRNGPE